MFFTASITIVSRIRQTKITLRFKCVQMSQNLIFPLKDLQQGTSLKTVSRVYNTSTGVELRCSQGPLGVIPYTCSVTPYPLAPTCSTLCDKKLHFWYNDNESVCQKHTCHHNYNCISTCNHNMKLYIAKIRSTISITIALPIITVSQKNTLDLVSVTITITFFLAITMSSMMSAPAKLKF